MKLLSFLWAADFALFSAFLFRLALERDARMPSKIVDKLVMTSLRLQIHWLLDRTSLNVSIHIIHALSFNMELMCEKARAKGCENTVMLSAPVPLGTMWNVWDTLFHFTFWNDT